MVLTCHVVWFLVHHLFLCFMCGYRRLIMLIHFLWKLNYLAKWSKFYAELNVRGSVLQFSKTDLRKKIQQRFRLPAFLICCNSWNLARKRAKVTGYSSQIISVLFSSLTSLGLSSIRIFLFIFILQDRKKDNLPCLHYW